MRWTGALLLVLAGCGKKEPDYLALLLTSSVKSVVAAPDSVKLLRLHPGPYPKTGKKIEAWPDVPTTAEVVADFATARELVHLLSDEKSYEFVGKGCRPDPGVKVQFQRAGTTIEAYLCFECLMIAYYGPGASGERGWGDFDPIARKLMGIVKRVFRDDPVIQGLK